MSSAAEKGKEESGAEAPEAELPPLPPWQPTRIARYPRNFKMAVTLVGWALLLSPLYVHIPKSWESKNRTITHIEAADNTAKTASEKNAVDNNTSVAGSNETQPAANAAGGASNGILNDQDDKSIKLAQAPDIGLTEDTAEGSLPRIGEDGRMPWQVYARPFNMADQRPRIALLITDLGLSRLATDAAINRMPANVTLAFDVQSPVAGAWCARARQEGHEVFIQLPMEPFDYPRSDPGPNTMLTTLPGVDILSRLNTSLKEATGYVGVTTLSGSRFTTDPDKLGLVLDVFHKRGLMIFDARVAPHSAIMDMARNAQVPAVAGTLRLDQNPAPEAIDQMLDQAEKTARQTGRAVIVSAPLPVVLDHLQTWLQTLPQRGIALAPVSAMVQ